MFVGTQMVEKEGSFAHLETARGKVECYERPQAYYVDQNKVFRFVENRGVHVHYSVELDEGEVQLKRALGALDIGLIYTGEGSPQAKGKVEKGFDYLQRRVPYLCERHHVRTPVEAQPMLQDSVEFYNEKHVHQDTGEISIRRWRAAILAGNSYLRPLPKKDLDPVFFLYYERSVKTDGTFSFQGKEYKLHQRARALATLYLIPHRKLLVAYKGQKVGSFTSIFLLTELIFLCY